MSRAEQRNNKSKSALIKEIVHLKAIIYYVEKAILEAGLTITKGPNGFIVEAPAVEVPLG